jgi:ABC-2 type transport system ATP-binding protein
MICVKDVFLKTGKTHILKDINFQADKGSVYGLAGPDNSGKSALMKLIAGVWEPDTGEILLDGNSIVNYPSQKRYIGYVPDECHYYSHYKVSELVRLYKMIYKDFDKDYFIKLGEEFELKFNLRIRQLSRDLKTVLGIILSLSIRPKVLIMEQPFNLLDTSLKEKIVNLVKGHVCENNTTVLVTTGNPSELEGFVDHLAVIKSGVLSFSGSVSDAAQSLQKIMLVFECDIPEGIGEHPDIVRMERDAQLLYVTTKKGFDLGLILDLNQIKYHHKVPVKIDDIYCCLLMEPQE